MSGLDKLGEFKPITAPPATTEPVDSEAGTPLNAPVADIHRNPNQPRRVFDKDALQELTDSIKEHGLIQPIIVYATNKGYKIIAGERRWRACKAAGLATMPVIVRDGPMEEYAQIAENEARDNLKPLELAAFIKKQLDAGTDDLNAIADKLGKSATIVSQLNSLNDAPKAVRDALEQGRLTSSRTANDLIALYKTHDDIALDDHIAAMPEIGRGHIAGIASKVPILSRQKAKKTGKSKGKITAKSESKTKDRSKPFIDVNVNGKTGNLVLNRTTKTTSTCWVRFDGDGDATEVNCADCSIIEFGHAVKRKSKS